MSSQDLIRAFWLDRQARNVRPATLKYYRENLEILTRHARKQKTGLADLTRADLIDSIIEMQAAGLSARTVNCRVRAWRAFYRFLSDKDVSGGEPYIDTNPALNIPLLRVDESPPEVLTPNQIIFMLKSLDQSRYTGARNLLILGMMYDAMLRIGEVSRLDTADIDLNDRLVVVRVAKGRSYRTVPISAKLTQGLHRFLVKQRNAIPGSHLFVTADGVPLSRDRIEKIIQRISKRLPFHVHAHKLRRSGATEFCRQGGSLAILQRILGHRDIRTTMRYVCLTPDDVQREHDRFSPVNALMKETG